LGADDYVTKPFDRRELMARIRTKLRVKQAEDALRRRNRELSLLPEIGRTMSASLDVNELATTLLKRTVETLGAIFGHLLLLNQDGTLQSSYRFSAPSAESLSSDLPIERQPVLDGLLETVNDTQQGFIVQDTLDDKRWRSQLDDLTRSAVIVPLLGRRNLLGLLILTHEQENYFNLDHLLLLQAIASQAAIAVENSSLYASVEQQQHRLTAVLQNAEEAILIFDTQGRISLLNSHAEQLFNEHALKLGKNLPSGQGVDALAELLEQVRISHSAKSAEIVLPGQRIFAAQVTPVEESGSLVILHDVTHFKNLEKIKNEFIATASHDLKNPITTIAGFANLLPLAGSLNEKQTDFVQRIQNAANHMTELVQNMLELARMDIEPAQKQELVDMCSLLGEMENEFAIQAKQKGQKLAFSRGHALVYVQGNPLQLRQVFRNLIGNAIKYTPQNGSITVTLQKNSESLRVKVEDTGIGIPKEDLPLIFNRFYRVRSDQTSDIEGNGLGLSIVKTITEQHGGQVGVESESGHGSCFSVTLPVQAAPHFSVDEKFQTRPVY
jgi:signal transduction histidine kinase